MSLTLRQRVLWWSMATTMVVMLVTFLCVDTVFRNTIRADQRENLLAGARLLEVLRGSEVTELQDMTTGLATTPTLRAAVETADPATIRENLVRMVEPAGLDWLAVTSPEGELLAATDGAPAERVAEADRLVAEARHYDTGDLWLRDGRLEQVQASAVFFGATQLGVLFSGRVLGADQVSRLEAATQQRVAVLADGGIVAGAIAAAGPEGGEEAAAEMVEEWSRAGRDPGAASPGAVREFSLASEQYVGTALPLPDAAGGTVGRLVTYRSLEEAMRPANRLRLALLLIAILGVVLAFVVSDVLSRRVTRPVDRLLRETVRLGSGELDQPIEPERDDEIGALARGFDHMRRSLRGAREELVRAERLSAIGRAASAIVHDFRQPVTAIQGHVDLLQEDQDEEERREDLAVIRTQLKRLTTMMSEILEFARGGQAEPDFGMESVPFFLDAVASGLGSAVRERDLRVEVEHGYEGNWRLDGVRTRRALENLAGNAVAALPPGGTLRLESHRNGEGLRLVVADDGPGIPPEIQDTLFEPFVTHGKKNGTGLGLAIVKTFVETQGGRVRFETSDRGTRFILEFQDGEPEPEEGAAVE